MIERNEVNFVTRTTAVQLRIKEIITQDILNGVDRERTFRQLKTVIQKFGATISDEYVRQQFEIGLARGAVKLYEETAAGLEEISRAFAMPLVALMAFLRGGKNIGEVPSLRSQDVAASSAQFAESEYLFEDRINVPDINKKLKVEVARLMSTIADKDIKDVNGASLRNVAEIHVRHEYQQNSIAQMRSNGVKLVWASTHVDCSPRCFPWQGKLYSLDGTSGTTSTGVPYQPLEVAVNVPYTTKAGKTYMNGLLGFNCRHRLIPYKDEQVPPKGYTKAQTVRAYQLDLRQREMEREIRRVKERAHLLKGVEDVEGGEVSQMFAEARKMTEAYRKFCRDNNRVAMIYRTQVTVEEQAYNQRRQHTVYNDVVDKSTGEIVMPAGTHLDKVRLIFGDGAKKEFNDREFKREQLGGNPLLYRKMSGIIIKNDKRVDVVHWVQNEKVDKIEEKDTSKRGKK